MSLSAHSVGGGKCRLGALEKPHNGPESGENGAAYYLAEIDPRRKEGTTKAAKRRNRMDFQLASAKISLEFPTFLLFGNEHKNWQRWGFSLPAMGFRLPASEDGRQIVQIVVFRIGFCQIPDGTQCGLFRGSRREAVIAVYSSE